MKGERHCMDDTESALWGHQTHEDSLLTLGNQMSDGGPSPRARRSNGGRQFKGSDIIEYDASFLDRVQRFNVLRCWTHPI